MALFMMLGKYSDNSVDMINATRTQNAVGVIEKVNGQIISMYAMLGIYDVILVVNLPGNREAMEVSVGLTRETGIHFTTGPVIPIEHFDEMVGSNYGKDIESGDFPEDFELPDGETDRT